MGGKSGLLQKLQIAYNKGLDDGEEVMKQFMFDTFTVACHSFGLGPVRMRRLLDDWRELYAEYYPVFKVTRDNVECINLRDRLDRLLEESMPEGVEFMGFAEQYPKIKEDKIV